MAPSRWFAVGDPQTSRARFFSFLDRAGVLGADGRLLPDVGLVSIGDHFDYGRDAEEAAREGTSILRWLASHPPEQVALIAGNHDLSRVMELAFESDASFAEARSLAAAGDAGFAARFPHLPTPDVALKDFCGFRVEQRALVQELLLQRRFLLGLATSLGDQPALIVHAGLSTRELSILGAPDEREPRALASLLNRWLFDAVDRVAPTWSRGEPAALSLEPLHVAGCSGREGGGFLYHRPVNPERPNRKETALDLAPDRPRRFDARILPRGLLQIVGHTSHTRSRVELVPWTTARAAATERGGGHRTLRMDDAPVYDLGVLPHHATAATVVMIDGGMSDPAIDDVELLPIGAPR